MDIRKPELDAEGLPPQGDPALAAVAPTAQAPIAAGAGFGLLLIFTLTTFLSATLLFSIQPMFAKMVLPVLGGSPSVWAVALCFFQGALLAGYCYAHALVKVMPVRTIGFVHLGLCLLAATALPIGLPAGWGEPPAGEPYLWQLGLFAVAVGLPFVAVAANAPLLQAWFAATGHRDAHDPYFLYAASNLGSLIALLSYPLILEPVFGLSALTVIWSVGFGLLIAAIAMCFVVVRATSGPDEPLEFPPSGELAPGPNWHDRAGWVGLALVPSALLTAFTAHVTTDVASAPLLWVLPLSLYLLTFVLVFRDRPVVPEHVMLAVHLAAVILALLQLAQTRHDGWFVSSVIGVMAFVAATMVAHRALYERRPAAAHLTEFYLWMSLGGVLGGVFAALVAPKLFSEIFEYPLLLALTMVCRPGALRFLAGRVNEGIAAAALIALGLLLVFWGPLAAAKLEWTFGGYGATAGLVALFSAAMIGFWAYPVRQLALALLMFYAVVSLPSEVHQGDARRSYFGVYRVSQSEDGQFNVLTHGTTLHGAQRIRDEAGNLVADVTPGTYYYPKSPMAKSVEIIRGALAMSGATGRYGVIGLGAGSLACLSRSDEAWRFFEIDPVVVDIAAASNNFTYIVNCQPKSDIVLGDARLTLAKEPAASFDLIIVDAFTSDAVPVHLMTVEAVRLYLSKLTPTGVVVLHISNRYLDLDSVLGAALDELPGVHGLLVSDDGADGSYNSTSSTVAVFARTAEVLYPFRLLEGASELQRDRLRPWTDDHSDILWPFLLKNQHRFDRLFERLIGRGGVEAAETGGAD